MKVLVTANSHPLYGKIVTLAERTNIDGTDIWTVKHPVGPDGLVVKSFVEEGQFRVIKIQEGE